MKSISTYIDHTMLKADATTAQIEKLCSEAKQYQFASVCVNPCHVALCSKLLNGSGVNVCTVIGFPLGASTSETKAFETTDAIAKGANEVDMVINIGALKDGNYALVENDIKAVVNAAKGKALVKVIIETCLLTHDEKVKACELVKSAGSDYVKTSTGFSTAGATKEDIELMKSVVGTSMGIKAAGGIRSFAAATEMINAGATRIGASASIKMIEEQNASANN